MSFRRFMLGAAAGASAGYAAWRWCEALRALRRPPPPLAPDARRYGRLRRVLAVTGTIRSLGGALACGTGPLADAAMRVVRPLPPRLRGAALGTGAVLLASAAEFGTAFVEDYEIERRFGLSDRSRAAWLGDELKATLLGSLLAAALAALGVETLRRFPRGWPIAAGLGLLPLYVLANVVVPIAVLPLFNRYEPLRGPLEARIRALASRYGVGDAEILRVDMSRRTKKANAFVTGIGSTHRIVLGDTLIDRFPEDEILFVTAHELGHYVARDTWRSIAVAEAASLAALAAGALAQPRDAEPERAALRIFAIVTFAMQMLLPVVNAFSRSREWAADRFAVAATGDAPAGARAFVRLRDQNLAEDDLPAWYEFWFSSHPTLGRRINALRAGASR